jgi:hypothetical protein
MLNVDVLLLSAYHMAYTLHAFTCMHTYRMLHDSYFVYINTFKSIPYGLV